MKYVYDFSLQTYLLIFLIKAIMQCFDNRHIGLIWLLCPSYVILVNAILRLFCAERNANKAIQKKKK